MEMTDEVHWSDVYGRNGTLTTYEMGDKRVGKWWVQKDELCQDRGKGLKACYEVWISGKKVELRWLFGNKALMGEQCSKRARLPEPVLAFASFSKTVVVVAFLNDVK